MKAPIPPQRHRASTIQPLTPKICAVKPSAEIADKSAARGFAATFARRLFKEARRDTSDSGTVGCTSSGAGRPGGRRRGGFFLDLGIYLCNTISKLRLVSWSHRYLSEVELATEPARW